MADKELKDDGFLSGCIAYILCIAALSALFIWIFNGIDKRDNYIRDLQRRIAVLEQKQNVR